jgi:uncharacterized cupredoxin-like copper-binding protein
MPNRLPITIAALTLATPALATPALATPALATPVRAADPTTLTVVMIDNQFQPDHITFHAGQTYLLRLENHGKDMHEFTAPAFLQAAHITEKQKLANNGTDVVIQPGKTVTLHLTAPAKGHYDLKCADHDWDGMVGNIDVN